MQVDRGVMGRIPWAAVGEGPPVVVLAGLSPHTGVAGDTFVRTTLAPVSRLTDHRQIFVLNRHSALPDGMTMADLAAEHADALRAHFAAPVDLVGMSTGGSIAQQLAAEHPDAVRRLVLLSTACRLGPVGQRLQSAVAVHLRAGRTRRAMAVAAGGLVPKISLVAAAIGWCAARQLLADAESAADLATTIEAEDAFDLARCAGVIEAPTLIIAGGRDRFYGRGLFEQTAALIPSSRLQVFPRKGHIGVTTDARARAQLVGFLDAT